MYLCYAKLWVKMVSKAYVVTAAKLFTARRARPCSVMDAGRVQVGSCAGER